MIRQNNQQQVESRIYMNIRDVFNPNKQIKTNSAIYIKYTQKWSHHFLTKKQTKLSSIDRNTVVNMTILSIK